MFSDRFIFSVCSAICRVNNGLNNVEVLKLKIIGQLKVLESLKE